MSLISSTSKQDWGRLCRPQKFYVTFGRMRMTEEQAKTCQAFADAYRDAVDCCKSMSDLDIHIREEMESKGYYMIDEDRPNDFRNYERVSDA